MSACFIGGWKERRVYFVNWKGEKKREKPSKIETQRGFEWHGAFCYGHVCNRNNAVNLLTPLLFWPRCLHLGGVFWELQGCKHKAGAFSGSGLSAGGTWETENIVILAGTAFLPLFCVGVLKSIPCNFDSQVCLKMCMGNVSVLITNGMQKHEGHWNRRRNCKVF